jgi:predicted transcriptional regulator
MQILAALWDLGPSTVRQVHEALGPERKTGCSSTLKMMQVMTEKGLLLKDDGRRPQVYRPAKSREKVQTNLVRDLVQRAFGGAVGKLVLRAVADATVSPQDLAEIRNIIQRLERKSP